MWGIVFKLFGIAVGCVLIFFAAANALRSKRRLDKRIAEFKAEQEELEKQGRPLNPYAALAELYTEETQVPPTKPRSRSPRLRR